MRKLYFNLILSIITFVAPLNAMAVVNILEGQAVEPVQEINVEGNSIHVKYSFPEMRKISIEGSGDPVLFSIPGFGNTSEPNLPSIPSRIDTFQIPAGYKVQFSSTESDPTRVICNYACNNGQIDDFKPYYETTSVDCGIYPLRNSEINREYTFRDAQLIEIVCFPIQYDYSNSTALLYDTIEYTLTFVPESQHQKMSAESLSIIEEELRDSYVTNISKIGERRNENGNVGYLIVSTKKFSGSMDRFIQWKQTQGFTVHTLLPESWNENSDEVIASVRDYISKYPEIKYILIIGDYEDVPAKSTKNEYATSGTKEKDLFFITDSFLNSMSDDNYIAERYVGRVSVKDNSQATNTLEKIMYHEMCPPVSERYYTHALHASHFETNAGSNFTRENSRFILTSEEIRDYVKEKGIDVKRFYNLDPEMPESNPIYYNSYYGTGKEIPKELQMPYYNWEYSPDEINDEINNGCLYAFYNSHGWVGGWCFANYGINNLNGLSNEELLPLVLNIVCHTGEFSGTREENLGECFAEEILRLPKAGASCVIAATHSTYYGLDNAIQEGVISAIWPGPGLEPIGSGRSPITDKTNVPIASIGEILSEGLYRMSQQYLNYDSQKHIKQHYRVLHIFGDPSMIFHTKKPRDFSDVEITPTTDGIIVETNGELATIGIYDYSSNKSFQFEGTYAYVSGINPKQTSVCLTGQNRNTYLWGKGLIVPENTEKSAKFLKIQTLSDFATSISILADTTSSYDIIVYDILGNRIFSYNNYELIQGKNTINLRGFNKEGFYTMTLCKDGKVIDSKKIML